MASNTFSIYAKTPLFEEIKQAHTDKDNPFDYRKIAVEAWERALHPERFTEPNPEPTQEDRQLTAEEEAVLVSEQAQQIEYALSWASGIVEAQAFLDHIATQGAWPISIAPAVDGRILMTVAWPKALTEQADVQPPQAVPVQ
jgi:hypothetical protein